MNSQEPRWLDVDDAARYLSLPLSAFYRAVRDGKVPTASRHLGERTPRWDRYALDAVMLGGCVTSTPSIEVALHAMEESIKGNAEARKGRTSKAA